MRFLLFFAALQSSFGFYLPDDKDSVVEAKRDFAEKTSNTRKLDLEHDLLFDIGETTSAVTSTPSDTTTSITTSENTSTTPAITTPPITTSSTTETRCTLSS